MTWMELGVLPPIELRTHWNLGFRIHNHLLCMKLRFSGFWGAPSWVLSRFWGIRCWLSCTHEGFVQGECLTAGGALDLSLGVVPGVSWVGVVGVAA